MSDLRYRSRWTFAEIGFEQLTAQRGIGHVRLLVRCRITPNRYYSQIPTEDRPWELRLGGWLAQGTAQDHVCDLVPVVVPWSHDNEYPNAIDVTLYGHVSFAELDAVNDRRPARDEAFPFAVHLEATAHGAAGTDSCGPVQLARSVAASEWRRMLDDVQHARYATIEIPVAGRVIPPAFEQAAAGVERARTQLDRHEWVEAIATCRTVCEALDPIAGQIERETDWRDLQNREAREALAFDQRLHLIRRALRHATHLAHHGGENIMEEARYVVDLTSVAVAYYLRRIR